MKKFIFFIPLALICVVAFAQSPPPASFTDIRLLKDHKPIEENTTIFIDSIGDLPLEKIPFQHFVPLATFKPKDNIPAKLVPKPAYLRFGVANPSMAPAAAYLFPGLLYRQLDIYAIESNGNLTRLEQPYPASGYLYLEMPPGSKKEFIVRLLFSKTTFNNMTAELVAPHFYPYYKMDVDKLLSHKKVVGLILSGILMMMILFTLVNFFLTGKREFLYNCIYSTCNFFLIFFTSYLTKNASGFKALFSSYLDLFLLIVGTIAYLAFTRRFLNTKTSHPKLDRFLYYQERILGILMVAYTILHFGTGLFTTQYLLEQVMKWLILGAGLVYIIVALVEKNKLMNYLAIGTAVQLLFSIISFSLILANPGNNSIFTSPFFYFEIGVIVSVIFFLLGLTYKNRHELIEKVKEQEAMKLEVEKKSFETKMAVMNAQQEERNRISADMHDDLGAGMTTIRLYSELAKNKIGNAIIPEIEKISASADELLNKMNAIIWSMSSSNDSLGNMVAYIRSYALGYFDDTGIKCRIEIAERLPNMEVTGVIRRNIFLVVKEALHNIVKHAEATEVEIRLDKVDKGLMLTIHDNGKGIDMDNLRQFGNGLKNMKKRMEDIDVSISIAKDNGTTIRLYRQTR